MTELRRFDQQALTSLVSGTPQPYQYGANDPLSDMMNSSTILPSRDPWYLMVSGILDPKPEVWGADFIAARGYNLRLKLLSREKQMAWDSRNGQP